MEKTRWGGLDAYRIFLMMMVCFIHFNAYSGVSRMSNLLLINSIFLKLFRSITPMVFNGFVLLSGFLYKEGKTVKRCTSLWMKVFFSSVILFVIGVLLSTRELDIARVLRTLFPFTTGSYWFVSMMVFLYVLAPLLSQMINKMSLVQRKWFCVSGVLVFSVYFASNPFIVENSYIGEGSSLIWYVYVFCMGMCIKLGSIQIRKPSAVLLLTISVVFSFTGIWFEISIPKYISFSMEYSLIPFLMSFSSFMVAKDCRIRDFRLLRTLSASAFFVFIVQEHDMIRSWFWELFQINKSAGTMMLIPKFILSVVVLWSSAIILWKWTDLLIKKIGNRVTDTAEKCLKYFST